MNLYSNKIRLNCSNFNRISSVIPINCYNCGMRNGYPQNLGGDKHCRHFKYLERRPHEGTEGEVK